MAAVGAWEGDSAVNFTNNIIGGCIQAHARTNRRIMDYKRGRSLF